MDRKSLQTLLDELNLLNLSDSHMEILGSDIKKKDIGKETVLQTFRKGYIIIEDIEKFPHCDYRITLEGQMYLHEMGKIINKYALKL